jgi:hypothetical protein
MNIMIRTVPHEQQRYPTVGDWEINDSERNEPADSMRITVSDLGDWRMEALVAIHELVEALLCKWRGITQAMADEWDWAAAVETEPGDDPECPYRNEQFVATTMERILATELGVDWLKYEQLIAAL